MIAIGEVILPDEWPEGEACAVRVYVEHAIRSARLISQSRPAEGGQDFGRAEAIAGGERHEGYARIMRVAAAAGAGCLAEREAHSAPVLSLTDT